MKNATLHLKCFKLLHSCNICMPSEWLFSKSGIIQTELCNKLNPAKLDQLTFKSNINMINMHLFFSKRLTITTI